MYPLYSARDLSLANAPFSTLLIVGPPRTGSSFIVEALHAAGGFCGSAEGHFFALMAELDSLVRSYYVQAHAKGLLAIPENTISQVPQRTVRQGLVDLFNRLNRQVFPEGDRMFDKTVNVEAIGALPYLLGIWPTAKVVYLKRDGVDNVLSAERYFGVDLESACRNWSDCAEEWDRIEPLLPAGVSMVVDHQELTEDPVTVCARLATHLELDPDTSAALAAFVVSRTATWRADRPKRKPLKQLGWEPERLATFIEICGRQMIRQGYASTEEVDEILAARKTTHTPLTFDAARVLSVDDQGYFVPTGGGWFVVPSRDRATTLIFEKLDVAGTRRLVGELALAHPSAQPVRVEIIGLSTTTGQIVVSSAVELKALDPVTLSLPLVAGTTEIDCIVRIALAAQSRTNDHAWVRMERLAFTL